MGHQDIDVTKLLQVQRKTETSMSFRLLTGFNAALALIMAGALLVAAPLIGNFAAYVALIAGLLCLVNPASWPQFRTVLEHRTVQLFLLSFGLITISLLYRATVGDSVSYVFDFLPLAFCIPAAIAFGSLRSRRTLDVLFSLALLGSGVSLATTAFGSFVAQSARPTGLELSPIHLSTLSLTTGFLAAGGFLSRPSLARAVFLLGPLLGFGAALLTGTRAAIPSTAMLMVATVVLSSWLFKVSARHVAVAAAGLSAVVAVLVFALATLDSEVGRAFFGIGDAVRAAFFERSADHSMSYRVEQYRAFWPAFLEAPVFGQGWHNQLTAAFPYFSDFAKAGLQTENWGYIHNEAMSMTLGMGILGLVSYVLILWAPLATVTREGRSAARSARLYAVVVILVGIIMGGLTDVLFMVELFKTYLAVICTGFVFVGMNEKDHSF